MQEIIRLNFVELAKKVDNSQTKERIKALKLVRSNLQNKFMKFYALFRHKKYGESFDPKANYSNQIEP